MSFEEELREENRKLRHLKLVVDLTLNVIGQTNVSVDEALDLVSGVRELALKLFPGKELAFELIYEPRFRRVLEERFSRSWSP
ncbi:MAG: hypothetical protein HY347_03250 [candidate division NC10 bacterium]|nr:hypothetical protein [candidate division NC10 bacterium]